ncbi:MAG TPA: hypothetical protein VGU69_10410 [Rhizomicrobium sp.]|nr:hypothetical protein [Rhizomicrobium sp.]
MINRNSTIFAIAALAELTLVAPAAQAAPQKLRQQAPVTDANPTRPAANSLPGCRVVYMPPGSREIVEANINTGTRIQFSAKVKTYTDATPALWDSSSADDSVWIRPRTTDPQANVVGLSVVTAPATGGTLKYDFVVMMTPDPTAPNCVTVQDFTPSAIIQKDQKTVQAAQLAALSGELAQTRQQYDQDIQRMRRQVEQQAIDKIKTFESSIYTRYDWNGEGTNADDKNLISAVYDDGQNTFVRITTTAFGMPSLSGALDDKDLSLQSEYDDLTGVYKIMGLLDQIRVRLGNHVIIIKRLG